jgi:hypothetical protein
VRRRRRWRDELSRPGGHPAHARGEFARAESHARPAAAPRRRAAGATEVEIAADIAVLAAALAGQHRHDQAPQRRHTEAADCYRRALAIAVRTHPPDHPTTLRIHHHLRQLTATTGP